MCGIAGILRVHPPGTPVPPPLAAIPESWLDILDDSIKHRGPDGQGRFRDRATRPDGTVVDVALVHRRLSILDHAGGAQPMVSALGGLPLRGGRINLAAEGFIPPPATERQATQDLIAVVFNGCIYNHRELRKELQAAGHEFRTDHSDTEILIHGWREWGLELPERLNGMFAFMAWDRKKGELFVARDRFGEKPLYYKRIGTNEPLTFAISSSVPGLAALPSNRVEPSPAQQQADRAVIGQWIRFGFFAEPPVTGVGEVWPGRGGIAPIPKSTGVLAGLPLHEWWRRWDKGTGTRAWHPAAARIDELLQNAVAERLEADVPVGCFLSGGVDSSLIAVHAHRIRPDVHAFTVRMPEPRFDESSIAREVARRIGITHTVLDCDAHPAEDLIHLIHQLGLPFGDSSLLPSYWVCKAAAAHVKVALSGDGADELFGGYRRYQAAHGFGVLGVFRHLMWPLLPIMKPDADPRSGATQRARFVEAAVGDRYQDLISIYPLRMARQLGIASRPSLTLRLWVQTFSLIGDILSPLHEWATRFRVVMAIASDLGFYLPEDILRKTDTASMAIPIEVRAPYLDRELAAAARQTRISHLMPHGQRKGLLRTIARKYLPSEIVDRPKQGFAIPIGDWFRTDYGGMKQLLLDHLNSANPWGPASLGIDLNMKFVRQMLDEHMGTGMSGRITRDHSQRLYMLLVLSIWAKWMGNF